MRRGTFKKGSRIPVDSIAHFDTIIHPEDSVPLAPNELEHGVESITCAPIVLLDESDLLPRRLHGGASICLSKDVWCMFNSVREESTTSIPKSDLPLRRSYRHTMLFVIGESMLGERIDINLDRVVLLRDYPNSMYFNAFDATVQAEATIRSRNEEVWTTCLVLS